MTTEQTGEVLASPPSTEQRTGPASRATVKFDAIPSDLKQADQWVLWKYEERNGKRTKVPYQPNGTKASSTDKSTWSTFEVVKTAYEKGGFEALASCLETVFLAWIWIIVEIPPLARLIHGLKPTSTTFVHTRRYRRAVKVFTVF